MTSSELVRHHVLVPDEWDLFAESVRRAERAVAVEAVSTVPGKRADFQECTVVTEPDETCASTTQPERADRRASAVVGERAASPECAESGKRAVGLKHTAMHERAASQAGTVSRKRATPEASTDDYERAASTASTDDGERPVTSECTEIIEDDWVEIASVLGTDTIPAPMAYVLTRCIDRMLERDEVSPTAPWLAIEYLAADYLSAP